MSISTPFAEELTQEGTTTRRVLSGVPGDHLSWRPHPRSWSLGQLTLHIARLTGGIAELLKETRREPPVFEQLEATSVEQLLSTHDSSVEKAHKALLGWDDNDMRADWTLSHGDRVILTMPRVAMVRSIMLNHWYHHRGQLLVYLRLLDQPVPSVYGPTADENPFG
jgi:uncharacterized damage-inducible protein DinB